MFYFSLLDLETDLSEMQIEQKLSAICLSIFRISDCTCHLLPDLQGWILEVSKQAYNDSHPIFPNLSTEGDSSRRNIKIKIIFEKQESAYFLKFKVRLISIFSVALAVLMTSLGIIGFLQQGKISLFGFFVLGLMGYLPLLADFIYNSSILNQIKPVLKAKFGIIQPTQKRNRIY